MCRAYTKKEVREMLLKHLAKLIEVWARAEGQSIVGRLDGLVFSILSLIDGSNSNFPKIKLILNPHLDDQQYCKKNEENWFASDMEITDESLFLHQEWGARVFE